MHAGRTISSFVEVAPVQNKKSYNEFFYVPK